MNIQEIQDCFDNDGIEYTILDMINENNIEDPELKILWRQAKVALINLRNYVEKHV